MRTCSFLLIICLFSCSKPYSNELEAVLEQAGKNRRELEKVLKHYSREPADSLKWRAAEFLISNMPGKYSVYYDAPWNDVATVRLRWTSSSDKQKVLDTYMVQTTTTYGYGLDPMTHVYDANGEILIYDLMGSLF
jgi:hypothetical protein